MTSLRTLAIAVHFNCICSYKSIILNAKMVISNCTQVSLFGVVQ